MRFLPLAFLASLTLAMNVVCTPLPVTPEQKCLGNPCGETDYPAMLAHDAGIKRDTGLPDRQGGSLPADPDAVYPKP